MAPFRRRFLVLSFFVSACGGGATGSDVGVRMDFARTSADYFSAPFPSEDVRGPDGSMDLDAHPGIRTALLVGPALELVNANLRGFGTTSPVVFTFTGDIGTVLPNPDETLLPDATVQLLDLDTSPPTPRRAQVAWLPDGGAFGSYGMLSVLPVQGFPLEPGHLHAVVVRRSLGDAEGRTLRRSDTLRTLVSGGTPSGLSAAAATRYREALATLAASGTRESELAGLAVFETQDPVAEVEEFYAHARGLAIPVPEAPFTLTDTFPDYCVFESTIRMPSYQAGTAPFSASGGSWARDANGAPAVQEFARTRIFVTVPRTTMPAAGFPVVVHVRAGGGGRVPMVERGTHPTATDPAPAGTGPAMIYARAGYAGITIDGPGGGLRNPQGVDEQFLIFNVNNPPALLDNVRQYALETALTAHVVDGLAIDAASSGCAGVTLPGAATDIVFDGGHVALFGHSMGASIAPLAAAIEPRFRGVLLSGAGGSWIENVIYKRKPVPIRPFVAFQVALLEEDLTELDPGVGMLQWAGESADAQVYAPYLVHRPRNGTPRHVLMFQGLADHYIMPPIANALSLAGGFDLAGVDHQGEVAELATLPTLQSRLPWTGRAVVPFPVQGNVDVGGMPVTAAVVQYLADGIEDGHEVFFQLEPPRHQAQCFLASLLTGTPRIVAGGALSDPCP